MPFRLNWSILHTVCIIPVWYMLQQQQYSSSTSFGVWYTPYVYTVSYDEIHDKIWYTTRRFIAAGPRAAPSAVCVQNSKFDDLCVYVLYHITEHTYRTEVQQHYSSSSYRRIFANASTSKYYYCTAVYDTCDIPGQYILTYHIYNRIIYSLYIISYIYKYEVHVYQERCVERDMIWY